jgi:hypothetical protein
MNGVLVAYGAEKENKEDIAHQSASKKNNLNYG